jgi:hypothetical protein
MALLLIGDAVDKSAFVDDTRDRTRMVERVFRGAPDAGDAKLAATAIGAVIRAVNPAPCMAAANFDTPAMKFRVRQRLFDFLFGCAGLLIRCSILGGKTSVVK